MLRFGHPAGMNTRALAAVRYRHAGRAYWHRITETGAPLDSAVREHRPHRPHRPTAHRPPL